MKNGGTVAAGDQLVARQSPCRLFQLSGAPLRWPCSYEANKRNTSELCQHLGGNWVILIIHVYSCLFWFSLFMFIIFHCLHYLIGLTYMQYFVKMVWWGIPDHAGSFCAFREVWGGEVRKNHANSGVLRSAGVSDQFRRSRWCLYILFLLHSWRRLEMVGGQHRNGRWLVDEGNSIEFEFLTNSCSFGSNNPIHWYWPHEGHWLPSDPVELF